MPNSPKDINKLIEEVADAQEKFWDILRELERVTEKDIDGTQEIRGCTVETLPQEFI